MIKDVEINMKDEVETLNTRFYQFWCALDRYRDKMSDAAYAFMSDKLLKFYKEEYERIYSDYEIQRAREKFEAKEKNGAFVPRRWRAWWSLFLLRRKNTAAKLIEEKTDFEACKFFEECENRLAADREKQPPQESRKREAGGADSLDASMREIPKTGTMQRKSAGVNNQSEQAAPATGAKDRGEKTVSSDTKKTEGSA